MQRRSRTALARIGSSLLLFACSAAAPGGDEVFRGWAADHAIPFESLEYRADDADLSPFESAIGTARVVGFGEAEHNTHELLTFRNRLFRFLVERMGFTAIALESGFTESLDARSYIENGEGDANTAAMRGLSAGMGQQRENLELVRWMREYNAAARVAGRREIRLYGIDITTGGRRSGPWRVMDRALTYLSLADPIAAQDIRNASTANLPRDDGQGFGPLSAAAQRDFQVGIEAISKATTRNRVELIARTSRDRYHWALRDLVAARQLARCLPVTPDGRAGAKEWIPAVVCRDREMAENVRWALENEGRQGRLFIYAHNAHVMSWKQDGRRLAGVREKPAMMGAHLRRAYAEGLYVIASTYATASAELGTPNPSAYSLDRTLAGLGPPRLFVDLRPARKVSAVRSWLSVPRALDPNLGTESLVTASTAFDALCFIERLTPALPSAEVTLSQ